MVFDFPKPANLVLNLLLGEPSPDQSYYEGKEMNSRKHFHKKV
jgi:hypothetical protein